MLQVGLRYEQQGVGCTKLEKEKDICCKELGSQEGLKVCSGKCATSGSI